MLSHIACNEGDEAAFVELAEFTISSLNKLAKTKLQLQYSPVIEACMKLEDMAYMEALKDASLSPTSQLWQSRRGIEAYQDICETMLRNLESRVAKDWQQKFIESPPLRLFRLLSGRTTVALGLPELPPTGARKRGRSSRGDPGDASFSQRRKRRPLPRPQSIGIAKAADIGIAPSRTVPKF